MRMTDDEKKKLKLPRKPRRIVNFDYPRDPTFPPPSNENEYKLPAYDKKRDRIIGLVFTLLFSALVSIALASWWITP